jgi:PHS family inorganic phosphate transporter-like MFS transporter
MFFLMAALYLPLRNHNNTALFVIYCFLLFSLSFGPNVTTFVLPAETYPHTIRSTFNGMSAALGKLGAVVG